MSHVPFHWASLVYLPLHDIISCRQVKNIMGTSGVAPSVWQHYELLHSFLDAYQREYVPTYIYGLKLYNKMYLLQILGNTL